MSLPFNSVSPAVKSGISEISVSLRLLRLLFSFVLESSRHRSSGASLSCGCFFRFLGGEEIVLMGVQMVGSGPQG